MTERQRVLTFEKLKKSKKKRDKLSVKSPVKIIADSSMNHCSSSSVFLCIVGCVKCPKLSCNHVFLSDRWADMFSAKGCHDGPKHAFTHPFVQVK